MAFTPPLSLLAALAFLGTGAVLLLAAAAVVVLLLLRRFEPARRVLLGALLCAGAYAVVLLGFSLASSEKRLAAGDWKYFCEVDCHLAYSVVEVTATKTLGEPPQQVTAQGLFYVVNVKVWFDERTISSTRGNFPLNPPRRRLRVVDAQGRSHSLSLAGQAALPGGQGQRACLWQPLRPGESCTATLVFDLPAASANPRLLLTTADEISWLIIGHENSFFHEKILFQLEP